MNNRHMGHHRISRPVHRDLDHWTGRCTCRLRYVASWGMQDLRSAVDPAVVPVNRGIAMGDVAVQLPLFIIALIGLWKMRFIGAVAAWMSLSMHWYWIVTAWSKQAFYEQAGIQSVPISMGLNILMVVFIIISLWASWYLFKHRKLFE